MPLPLEFREAPLQKLWSDGFGGKPVPVELSSRQIRLWECVHGSEVAVDWLRNAGAKRIWLVAPADPKHRSCLRVEARLRTADDELRQPTMPAANQG